MGTMTSMPWAEALGTWGRCDVWGRCLWGLPVFPGAASLLCHRDGPTGPPSTRPHGIPEVSHEGNSGLLVSQMGKPRPKGQAALPMCVTECPWARCSTPCGLKAPAPRVPSCQGGTQPSPFLSHPHLHPWGPPLSRRPGTGSGVGRLCGTAGQALRIPAPRPPRQHPID